MYPLSETPVTVNVNELLDLVREELIDAIPEVLVVPLAEPLTAPLQVPLTVAPATLLPLLSRTVTWAVACLCPPLFDAVVSVKAATDIVDVPLVTDVVVVAVIVTLFMVARPELSVTFTLAV